MSQKNQGVNFFSGVLVGSALGTLVGILVAPRSGEETRRIIKKTASAIPEMSEDLSATLQLHSRRFSAFTQSSFNRNMTKLKKAIATGVTASQREISSQKSKIANKTYT